MSLFIQQTVLMMNMVAICLFLPQLSLTIILVIFFILLRHFLHLIRLQQPLLTHHNRPSSSSSSYPKQKPSQPTPSQFPPPSSPKPPPVYKSLLSPASSSSQHQQDAHKTAYGFIYKAVKSNRVLVEYKCDFYSQHHSNKKYDVSFSFNRVCLKRAHHAVETASHALLQNFIFPGFDALGSTPATPTLLSTTSHNLRRDQRSAVEQILKIKGSPPYIVTGTESSRIGAVISAAVYQLCQQSPECRILICAPTNSCCDDLLTRLAKMIPKSTMFRANAAFREKEGVSEDILQSSLYDESCFYCPPIEKLRKYRLIFSTFISSFRLHDKGIAVGHFSHIFLVDASSAIEPETLVTLTNFANKTTSVIVTGNPRHSPRWVRADIARNKGLKISYFERLCKCRLYKSLNPIHISLLDVK